MGIVTPLNLSPPQYLLVVPAFPVFTHAFPATLSDVQPARYIVANSCWSASSVFAATCTSRYVTAGVAVGVRVVVGVAVAVAVQVAVGVGVQVGVAVGVQVGIGVAVGVAVGSGASVGTAVAVGIAVGVGWLAQ